MSLCVCSILISTLLIPARRQSPSTGGERESERERERRGGERERGERDSQLKFIYMFARGHIQMRARIEIARDDSFICEMTHSYAR